MLFFSPHRNDADCARELKTAAAVYNYIHVCICAPIYRNVTSIYGHNFAIFVYMEFRVLFFSIFVYTCNHTMLYCYCSVTKGCSYRHVT